MNKIAQFASGLGCLVSVLAPVLAAVLYPKGKWLFALVLIGVAVLVLNRLFGKDPAPQTVADEIERLLNGDYYGFAVDSFEHWRIRDPKLKELWLKSMRIGGLPEEWVRLEEHKKSQLRKVTQELRELGQTRGAKPGS
jgi:hypothetical protein